jgi:uncharacterized membrane protein (DUF373 family)
MSLPNESLTNEPKDKLIGFANKIIIYSVKFLALLMVIVILWSLLDVIMHLYHNVSLSFESRFNAEVLLQTLGSFLAVLIAIEVFLNIVFYLSKDAIHVPLVLATALTAIARKVIIMDITTIAPLYAFAIAALIFALGISYWLVTRKDH